MNHVDNSNTCITCFLNRLNSNDILLPFYQTVLNLSDFYIRFSIHISLFCTSNFYSFLLYFFGIKFQLFAQFFLFLLSVLELNEIIFIKYTQFFETHLFLFICWFCLFDCTTFFFFSVFPADLFCDVCKHRFVRNVSLVMDCIFYRCFFLTFPLSRMKKLYPKREREREF